MCVLMVAKEQPLIERIVSLIRAEGLAAEGTASDDRAIAELEAGDVSTLVIGGGVDAASRERLRSSAQQESSRAPRVTRTLRHMFAKS